MKLFNIALLLAVVAEGRRRSERTIPDRSNRNTREEELPATREEKFKRTSHIPKKKMEEAGLECDEDEDITSKFMKWVSLEDKNYKTTAELDEKKGNWKKNNDEIRELNNRSKNMDKKNAATYAHNQFSDLSKEQREKMKGLKHDEKHKRGLEAESEMAERRELGNVISLTGNSVDHRQYMTGVKDQGYCGSCWVFGSNSALEGTINRLGNGTTALSDQMPVDCLTYNSANRSHFSNQGVTLGSSNSEGCNGGFQSDLYDFYMQVGTTLASDYRAYQGNEQSCSYQVSDGTQGQIAYHYVAPKTAQGHLDILQSRPVTVSYSSGSGDDFYSGGIIYSGSHGCGQWVNHAVAMVGYHSASAGTGDDPNCDASQTTTECTTEWQETEVTYEEMYCRYRRWYDDVYSWIDDWGYETGCYWDDETRYGNTCCWMETYTEWSYEPVETCTDVPVDCNSPGASTTGEVDYFIIQNSWGTGWGDNGYAYYAVEDGMGICDVYSDTQVAILSNE